MLNNPLDEKEEMSYKAYLESIGDSIVVVADDEIVKTHVHTNDPGLAIQKALTYGSLSKIKIDNMREEHQEKLIKDAEKQAAAQKAGEAERKKDEGPKKDMGFVVVSIGEGLNQIFRDLGADALIVGGQAMNPSTEDVLDAVRSVNADTVFVLPNNKNIILAAQQCVDLVEDKKVVVLQAKTVPQGISAMIAMNPDGEEAENTAAMEEAMGQVTTMEITYAARDSSFDGNAIQAGDYLLLVDNQLFGTEKSMETALEKLAQESQERGGEFISIFYGEGVQQGEAEQALAQFEAACPEAEITLLEGGQPVYHYLISVE